MATVEEIFEELEELKSEIAMAKQDKAEKTGQLSEQMKALKSFGIDSVQDAKKKIISMKKELEELKEKITTSFEKLKENYEW